MTDTLDLWVAVPVAILLIISGLITVTGSVGLLRFDHFHSRIHAPTLGNTVGAVCLLLASILMSVAQGRPSMFQEVLILLFLVITSPITAILLMQASLHRQSKDPRSRDKP